MDNENKYHDDGFLDRLMTSKGTMVDVGILLNDMITWQNRDFTFSKYMSTRKAFDILLNRINQLTYELEKRG